MLSTQAQALVAQIKAVQSQCANPDEAAEKVRANLSDPLGDIPDQLERTLKGALQHINDSLLPVNASQRFSDLHLEQKLASPSPILENDSGTATYKFQQHSEFPRACSATG